MGSSGSLAIVPDSEDEEQSQSEEEEVARCSRPWHREERIRRLTQGGTSREEGPGSGCDLLNDNESRGPEEDDYDPRKPEYVTKGTVEEIEEQKRQLLAEQIRHLDRALAFHRATGGEVGAQVSAHYSQVRTELCQEVVRGFADSARVVQAEDDRPDVAMSALRSRRPRARPQPTVAFYSNPTEMTRLAERGHFSEVPKRGSIRVDPGPPLNPGGESPRRPRDSPKLVLKGKARRPFPLLGLKLDMDLEDLSTCEDNNDTDEDRVSSTHSQPKTPKTPTKKRKTSMMGAFAWLDHDADAQWDPDDDLGEAPASPTVWHHVVPECVGVA